MLSKIGKHPDSVLAQTPKPTFTSRYADPSHPASSGSLISLVTGGRINPPTLQRGGMGASLGGPLGSGRDASDRGLGALLNRGGRDYDRRGWGIGGGTGSGELMPIQRGATTKGQDYTQGHTHPDTYVGRGLSTQGRFGGRRGRGGDMVRGGGFGLGNGPLGLPIPTPQMGIKKLIKKVSRPLASNDKRNTY